jgi:hypothetical protein
VHDLILISTSCTISFTERFIPITEILPDFNFKPIFLQRLVLIKQRCEVLSSNTRQVCG